MKQNTGSYGKAEVAYDLRQIFLDSSARFDQFHSDFKSARGRSETMSIEELEAMLKISQNTMQSGVVALISASAYLEQILYEYAVTHFTPESYDQHCGNMKFLSRWIVLPRLCENKHISEDHPAINDLRELIKARNAIIHPKIKLIKHDLKAFQNTERERTRFISACCKLRNTVTNLEKLLC